MEELPPLARTTTSPVDSLKTLKRSELKITRPAARGKCSVHMLGSTVNNRDIIVAMDLLKEIKIRKL